MYEVHKKCGFSGCPGDANITASIQTALQTHAEIDLWNINVQTLDSVVYLYGLVDTNLQKSVIESLALETTGVRGIVDSIVIRGYVR